jgi:hypothetical protein
VVYDGMPAVLPNFNPLAVSDGTGQSDSCHPRVSHWLVLPQEKARNQGKAHLLAVPFFCLISSTRPLLFPT